MSKLVLKNFTCIDKNDDDKDSPYFLVFTGLGADADVHKIRDARWDDTIQENTHWTGNLEVPGTVRDKSFVLVALLEQDDGVDIEGTELEAVRRRMKKLYSAFAPNGPTPAASRLLRKEFLKAINENTSNDDLIDIKHLPIPGNGQPRQLEMSGIESGYYLVKFALE